MTAHPRLSTWLRTIALRSALRSALRFALCLPLVAGTAHAETKLNVEVLGSGLKAPFAIEVLPDGQYLITGKTGTLLRLNPETGAQHILHRFNDTVYRGQGGLLDVALHPEFNQTPDIFITEVQRNPDQAQEVGVVLWRARLEADGLGKLRMIYRQRDTAQTIGHFGSRIAFVRSGEQWTLLLTLGEQQRETPAQNMQASAGKILALTLDGAPAQQRSPVPDALPEILSAGHRNPQGIDVHPATGEVWSVEHGPQGGDELNRIRAGRNYGWPLVSYGCPYGADPVSRCAIGGGVHTGRFEEPAMHWSPVSTAPSSLRFYKGTEFPEFTGDGLMTALAGRGLWRIRFNPQGLPVERELLLTQLKTRLRDSAMDAKGRIILIGDDGRVFRVSRAR